MRIHYVNGFKIRQFLDPDFNVLETSQAGALSFGSKWYIPNGEWWCDERFADEAPFLLAVERALWADATPSFALLRKKIIRRFTVPGPIPWFITKRSRHQQKQIISVDGSIVRRHIDPQFVMGGHDLVYPYIPKNEIWIDAKLDPREIPHVLAHESLERDLMSKGKSYDVAHDWATAAEKESRRAAGGAYLGDDNFPKKYKNLKTFIADIHVRTNK
ncbi:MAG: hypothetical protein WC246_01920 [Candidatus Paceibacterota bacterium]|jgi:hypothetical protein